MTQSTDAQPDTDAQPGKDALALFDGWQRGNILAPDCPSRPVSNI